MKICIVTGGTGGHIYPALALAQIWKEQEAIECFFIGNDDRMEAQLIPQQGFPFYGLHAKGLTGSKLDMVKSGMLMLKAEQKAKKILKKEKADLVIGFGGYVSAPVILAAKQLGIPTMLHEQNSLPGKSNLLLAKGADAIVTCYPKASERFPAEKTRLLGNPRASLVAKADGDLDYFKSLGLDPDKKTIMVMMGSLGSSSVNEAMIDALKNVRDFQILYICGKDNEDFKNAFDQENVHAVEFVDTLKIYPFLHGIIARAGATTLAEVSALGLPSILIPSPYVANNHQFYNASEMVDLNASVMVEEKDLNASSLQKAIDRAFRNDEVYEGMVESARAIGRPQAAYDMITLAHSLLGRDTL